ncbi:tandem-95 repeat protein [Psychromonas sp. MME2]|uniref:beta strand repeat-containing protein n=1 Tax=Psychromonas sp. MME2 TaxID=3231033 RepID=UPI00339BD2A2
MNSSKNNPAAVDAPIVDNENRSEIIIEKTTDDLQQVSELVNEDALTEESVVQLNEDDLAEINAIQAAIEGTDGPIEDIETAAGAPTSDGGSSGPVDFSREGAETIATTNFETQGFNTSSTTLVLPEESELFLGGLINQAPTLTIDNGVIDEDGGSITVPYQAADIDGTIVSTVATVPAEQGSVTVNETDGTITFTPAENFFGEATITLVTTDDDGATATTTSTITVNDINDAPTLSADNGSMDEDSGSITVPYQAADIDGTIVSTVATVPAEHGSVTVNETDGTITFTPAENFFGEATITLVTTDDDGATATTTSTITVNDINDAPTLSADNGSMDEDSGSITVPYQAADIDGTIVSTVATVPAAQGSVTVNETDGTITFTPAPNFFGEATITLVTTDDDGATATTTSTITVNDINDAPTLSADNGSMDEDSGSITVPYQAADIDGTIVSTVATVPAAQGSVTVNETDGTITFTPAPNFFGEATITLVTTDNDGATATTTSTITVNDINDAPTISADNGSMDEDSGSITVPYQAADIDGTIVSTVATVPAEQGSVTVNETDGTITFTPAENFFGEATITLVTTDDDGATATTTSTITVNDINDAPTLSADNGSMDEDSGSITVPYQAADIDGTIVSTVATVPAAQGSVTVNETDGTITFTPAPNFFGEATITLVTTDNDGATATTTSTISVNDINDAPTLSADNGSMDEDSGSITVPYQAADIDGTIVSTVATVPAAQGSVTVNETDGTITFTPAPNFFGEATITLVTTDDDGATATTTSTITVNDINDAPTISVDNGSMDEDSGSITVPYQAADVDGTIVSTVATVPAAQGSVTVNETDGTITFTPAPNFFGEATITLVTTDDDGATATTTSTITVNDINDAPTLSADNGSMDEDSGSITVPYQAADIDGTIVSTVATVPAAQGSVTVNETDGTITFTPAPNFFGEATITLVTTDNDGATATTTSTITVNDINDAPTISVDNGSMDEDSGSITVPYQAADIDGTIVSTVATVPAAQGSVTVNETDGTITFTPAPNFFGEATITLVTTDDDGATATTTSTITVNDINDAPTLSADNGSMDEDSGSITVPYQAADIDGTIVSTVATVPAAQGSVTVNETDGTITFTPAPNFFGEATITLVTTDNDGATATTTSTITVNDINDAPTISADNGSMDEDWGSITVPYQAADIDGTIVSTVATVPAEQGSVTVNETDGTITFTPAENFFGEATITLVTTDDDGATATTTSTITVNDINDAPTLSADNGSMDEDSGSITVPYQAADIDGTIVSTVATVPAAQGSVTVNETDGTITFTPAPNFFGEATITLVTTDNDGATATTTSTISVNDINDAPTLSADNGSMDEDSGSITVPYQAADIDGTIVSTVATVPAAQGSVTVNETDGTITFTPAPNFFGEATITLVTTDDDGATATTTSTITVNDINDAPTISVDNGSMDEDSGSITVPYQAADVDGTIVSTVATVPAAQGSVTVNETDGTITFTPAPNFFGEATITLVTTDDDGATATTTSTITVNDINDAPTLSADNGSMDEDSGSITVPYQAADIDGTIVSTVATVPAAQGSVTVNETDGTITFTPAPNFFGEATITLVTTDNDGATATTTSTISVNDINDAPTLSADNGSMDEDSGSITVPYQAADIDGTIVSTVATVPAAQGSVTVNETDGTITFTPAPNFFGEATITLVTTDNDGATATTTSTISVNDINDAPTLSADNGSMDEDSAALPFLIRPLMLMALSSQPLPLSPQHRAV